ncbi:MAG: hypothetical protein JW734_01135 [Candidatus Omnitrophica bacterium]|nr:hypothetical protein [Candidatus Omnitrophota bacterium]
MAEEVKQEQASQEESKSGGQAVKTAVKVILGVVLIALGILAVIAWWAELLGVIKGCIGLFLILVGAITVAIARD